MNVVNYSVDLCEHVFMRELTSLFSCPVVRLIQCSSEFFKSLSWVLWRVHERYVTFYTV